MSPTSTVYPDWADEPRPSRRREHRKQSLYLTKAELREMKAEAKRLGRSLSYIGQLAVKLALPAIRRFPDGPLGRGRPGGAP